MRKILVTALLLCLCLLTGAVAPGIPSAAAALDGPVPPGGPARLDGSAFGETYTYDDGLQVTVSGPEPYEPSEYAAAEEAAAYVTFTVTVSNGSAQDYDPSLFIATAQSASSEASQVFDSANGLVGTPSTTLLPGREVEFELGFAVADPDDVVVEVTPGFDYDPVIFTS